MRQGEAATGACLSLLLVTGCARPHPPASVPPPAVKPAAVTTAPPVPVLPDAAELNQELSIVASPQVSRDRSLLSADNVQDLGGSWVHYGVGRIVRLQRVLQKTRRADVPFTAQVIVTHAVDYSDVCPSKAQAAHAPLAYTQQQTTTYRYEYQASGTWAFQDQQTGPLIDKGRH